MKDNGLIKFLDNVIKYASYVIVVVDILKYSRKLLAGEPSQNTNQIQE